jgi:CoA:oxalate CoA-transferase
MPGPLAGVRVLDFTHALAGPFGTMILADLGAEVILVSRMTERDDEKRGNGPFVNGRSTYRFSVERGKRNVQLDLKKPEGLELALRLAEKSDVLTENFSPGTMDRLGLGYEVVARRNPRLIYASCSGHGQTGPYAERGAVDIIAQAMSGLMSITGEPDGRPMRVGASYGDSLGGSYLAMGVLAALFERERSGLGQRLDIAMVESLLYHNENAIIRYSATGRVPGRIGPKHPLTTPFQPFETKDGWIVIAGTRDWQAFCVVIGHEELADDPRFVQGPVRNEHHAELEPILIEAFRARTSEEWFRLLDGICIAAPVYNIAEAIDDPQIQARGMIVELPVPGPEERRVRVPKVPVRLSRTMPVVDRPAPFVGEDTREVLEKVLALSAEEIAGLESGGVIRCR